MMHEFFELTINQVIELSDDEFLERCSECLELSLADQERREVDHAARDYGRRYLGEDPGSDLETWLDP